MEGNANRCKLLSFYKQKPNSRCSKNAIAAVNCFRIKLEVQEQTNHSIFWKYWFRKKHNCQLPLGRPS